MRWVTTALAILMIGSAADTIQADPYKWCAEYSGGDMGGSSSCYFWTIEQCRAAVSGVGGFCRENPFYNGKPVTTPDDPPAEPAPARASPAPSRNPGGR
jgi:hypothetical protein